MKEPDKEIFLYIGSWEHSRSQAELGIRAYKVSEDGFTLINQAGADVCVGSMYFDKARDILYCVDESETLPGRRAGGGGRVLSFCVNRENGTITPQSESPAFGSRPSGVLADETGKYLLVTNHSGMSPVTRTKKEEDGSYSIVLEYDEANVVLYDLNEDGSIGSVEDISRHSGCGTENPYLQAHPHCVRRSPFGNLYCVCDKGADALYLYSIDYENRRLILRDGSPYKLSKGCKPRYCVFHPDEKIFVINYEGKNELTSFRYDMDGKVEQICSVTVIPEDAEFNFKGGKRNVQSSDMLLHPDGIHIYNITRGVNEIDVYSLDSVTAQLLHEQTFMLPMEQGGVDTIRAFGLSPDAKHLFVGAMQEDRVIALDVADNGQLSISETVPELAVYHPAAFMSL